MKEDALFATSWLELREPLDHRSRARALLPPLRAWWRKRLEESASGGRIVDLGCGTGANLRYLAPLLPGAQQWTLVDHDPDLLALVEDPGGLVRVEKLDRDLTDGVPELLGAADLVTASAFLDLVSREWLVDVVDGCRRSGAAAYFALTYDGDFRWYADEARRRAPDGPDDEAIRDAVNAHQRGDKGFGRALGPDAAPEAARLFGRAGSAESTGSATSSGSAGSAGSSGSARSSAGDGRAYRVWIRPSPWVLGPRESPVARELLDGWAAAAREARPRMEDDVRTWADHRRALIDDGTFGLTVGHLDVLALPGGPRGVSSDVVAGTSLHPSSSGPSTGSPSDPPGDPKDES